MKFLLILGILGAGAYLAHDYLTAPEPIIGSPQARLAPEGIYFLKERFSETTSTGVRALLPGTRVKLTARDPGGNWQVVSDDGLEFTVPSRILTHDLDVRDAILRSIADTHAKIQAHHDDQLLVARHEKDARIAEKRRNMDELQLKLDELQALKEKAEQRVELEIGRSQQLSLSGGAMADERSARAHLAKVNSEIDKIKARLKQLQLEVRKEAFSRTSD